MKVVVVYSHPNPGSFNAAILAAVQEELGKKGAEVRIKDLYTMKWNPVLSATDFQAMASGRQQPDVAAEQADIKWADLIIFISPIWWYTLTAMMKGYVDRVFSLGFAYEYRDDGAHGLMKGKKAIFITTSGADAATSKATGMDESMRISLVGGMGGFCGFDLVKHLNCYAVPTATDQERQQMLSEVHRLIEENV